MTEPLKDLRDLTVRPDEIRPDDGLIIAGADYLQMHDEHARLHARTITPDEAAAILKALPRGVQPFWIHLEQKLQRIADSDPLPLRWGDDATREDAEEAARRLGPHPHARPGGHD